MSVRIPGRPSHAAAAVIAGVVIAGVVIAALAVAGCSGRSATSRGSVESCIHFGIGAIRHQVTVTSLPPACEGLTRAQVNFAVGSALHSAAVGARGKIRQRDRVAKVSHFLQRLLTLVRRQHSSAVPAPAGRQVSRASLGLVALCTWLVTAGLGLWMMARWAGRGGRRRAPAGQPRRPPALNLAHLGLATAGLLAWIAYAVTGVAGVAWAACALLPEVAGLGMTLVFLAPSTSPAATAQVLPAGTPGVPAGDDPPRARRLPVLVVSAHIAFAIATILFAFLTVVASG